MLSPRILAMALGAIAGLSFACPIHAGPWERDLGPIPSSGVAAAASLRDRARRVILEMACGGDEAAFLDATMWAPKDRPVQHVIAKAAAMADWYSDYPCKLTQAFNPADWHNAFNRKLPAQLSRWQVITLPALVSANAGEIHKLLNDLFEITYGPACRGMVQPLILHDSPRPADIEYSFTGQCLESQIAHVILAKDFGRNGRNPGSSGLPCALAGKAPEGDWDMGVTQLTRVTFFMRQVERELGDKGRETLDKLHTRLLTLSGEPATEVHHLAKCGNPDNHYGSARDRLDDEDFYDEDLGETVEGEGEGGSSGCDFLGIVLLLLALLLLGGLLAALAALAAMSGPMGLAALAAALLLLEVPQAIAGAIFGGIEETENHLLMQNSAKYLKNKMAIAELQASNDQEGIAEYEEFNKDLYNWFMARLQRIARDDFVEYNARPYGRLSMSAILNLHDFACDTDERTVLACNDDDRRLVTAAASVIDLTAAKGALASNQARRIVPFRRLAHTNTNFTFGKLRKDGTRGEPQRLFDLAEGADHMVGATQFWTGETSHGPGRRASRAALTEEMIWHATSSYRPHALILDIAIDKSTRYAQTFRHAGWEKYSSGPGWLLTAGGTSTEFAQGFRTPFGNIYIGPIKDSDRGAGVPTTLIVTSRPPQAQPWSRQDRYQDFIRFEGRIRHWPIDEIDEPMSYEGNLCVHGSFACGINMHVPQFLDQCMHHFSMDPQTQFTVFSIIDSGACEPWNDGDPANDFYAIIFRQACFGDVDGCAREGFWGHIEIVSKAIDTSVDALAQRLKLYTFDGVYNAGGGQPAVYRSVTNGAIKFDPDESAVLEVNNRAVADPDDWPRAVGDIINRVGDAHYTIRHPRGGQVIEIDFSNQHEPRRVLPP